MAIAAQLAVLGYKSESVRVRLLMGGAVALGFLSHLILDELYSVEWTGVRLKLNQAAGSALKLFGRSLYANVLTYTLLVVVTYFTAADLGFIPPPRPGGAPMLPR
ncbi:MAG TPA: hypothetical protein EYP14_18175 [Planctomycetaceae bacterium]|nr:hypothetical protein [Planctomycetaceae bacterium]